MNQKVESSQQFKAELGAFSNLKITVKMNRYNYDRQNSVKNSESETHDIENY